MTVAITNRLRAIAYGGAALAAGVALAWWVATRPEPAVYDIPRTVRYSVTVTNPTNEFQEAVEFWVFAPVRQTAFQRVKGIEATLPYTLLSDSFGNQRLVFAADIPPFGSKTVSVDAHLDLASVPNRFETVSEQVFLQPEHNIESDAAPISDLGRALTRKTALQTSDAIYSWVSSSLEYSGYVRQDRGALYALNERQGDCTEYSYLYTALARSTAIPSRPVAGFVTAENAVLRARDIHNWAEASLEGKWRVIDPQNKRNRINEHHHIAMRLLGASDEHLSSTHQLIGAAETLEIVMN